MKQAKISIIVPIYNIADFLPHCVESILAQDYKNLEIFLIDDGSTDESPKICDDFAKQDQRIKVIHQKNAGVSAARNNAIKKTTGEYIFCIDGDDCMEPDTLSHLYKNLTEHKADLALCYLECIDKPCKEAWNKHSKNGRQKLLNTDEALKALMYTRHCPNSPWGKLYKAELFNGIEFPQGEICEDLATVYRIFAKCNKIHVSYAPKYKYFVRQGSLIHRDFNENRAKALDFVEKETHFIAKTHPKALRAAQNREFMEAILILTQAPDEPEFAKYRTRASKIYQEYRKNVLTDIHAKPMSRFYALIGLKGVTKVGVSEKSK